jgi:hypothetical protein
MDERQRRAMHAKKQQPPAKPRRVPLSDAQKRLLWTDDEGARVVSLAEFLKDNEDGLHPEELKAVRRLRPGQSLLFGGGAQPNVTIEALPKASTPRRVAEED